MTEDLFAKSSRHRLLLMLDEFPALGRLDFFETALAFMAGYGLKSFLIAQSLNQIEKAYGQNNSILDNCHVRVAFAANDERTAKRLSDALGIATELRAMKNYAGHRLSPWLGHLMVSRQETARPLLTAGEVMQLPPSDELVLVSGTPPILAKKARYFKDRRLAMRVLPPPTPASLHHDAATRKLASATDWATLSPSHNARSIGSSVDQADTANSGIRREPELPEHELITREAPVPLPEFTLLDDERIQKTTRTAALRRSFTAAARQAAMDPDDGMAL